MIHLRHTTSRSVQNRRGIAAVEFAVVAPLLVLFVFGIIEIGRLMVVQQVLTNATREGARQAVVFHTTGADVNSIVGDYLTSGSVHGATVSVTPNDLNSLSFGDQITVSASVPFADVSWLGTPFLFKDRVLSASTMMRAESP